MTAGSRLPWPTGWTAEAQERDNLVLAALLSFLLGAVLALLGLDAARDGDRTGVVFFILSSWIFVCGSIGLCLTRGWRRRRRAIQTEWVEVIHQNATVIPCSRATGIAGPVIAVSLLPFTGFISFAYGTAVVESGGRNWTALIISTVATLVCLSMVALLMLTMPAAWTRVRELVAVSSTGIYQRGPTWSSFFPWEEILAIDAIELNGPFVSIRRRDENKLFVRDMRRFRLGTTTPASIANRGIATTSLAVDPAIVYHGIRFYHENPRLRSELTHETGAERFRLGTFSRQDGSPT